MAQFHDDPGRYLAAMRAAMPRYDEVQDALVAAAAEGPAADVLDLGTGTGETAARLLGAHPTARLTAVDASERMLAMARARLPGARLVHARLEDALPPGPFDLVSAAFAVHHLDAAGKEDLFHRVRDVLRPGGRLVIADVVRADHLPPAERTPIDPAVDHPDPIDDQVAALRRAAFERPAVTWRHGDLAVLTATLPVRPG